MRDHELRRASSRLFEHARADMADADLTHIYRPASLATIILLAVICAFAFGPRVLRAFSRRAARTRPQVLGTLLVLLVVVLWTASSLTVQHVFEAYKYRKPFFLTYFSTSSFIVYLPCYPERVRNLISAVAGRRPAYELVVGGGASTIPGDDSPRRAPPTPCEELSLAVRLGMLFFAYQVSFVIGLELTTVSLATILSASSGLFTLLFSALRLKERVGPVKLLSTLLSFGGVLLVVRSGGGGGPRDAVGVSPRWGNAATLLSALLYGGYAAQIKREVPDESLVPMPYLFGLIGLCTCLLLAPCLPVLHALHIERFSPPSGATLFALVVNALLGSVLSNMLLARAMLLASPLVATVGLSLSIPLAMAADASRGRGRFSPLLLLGTAAVWAGFVGVSLAEPLERRLGRLRGWRSSATQKASSRVSFAGA